jgi:hypothetical protein
MDELLARGAQRIPTLSGIEPNLIKVLIGTRQFLINAEQI